MAEMNLWEGKQKHVFRLFYTTYDKKLNKHLGVQYPQCTIFNRHNFYLRSVG